MEVADPKEQSSTISSLSTLPDDANRTILSFLDPKITATTVSRLSSELKDLSEENYTWNNYLKPQYQVSGDTKESAQKIYENYPERRSIPPKPSTLKGEKGADICRTLLNIQPDNLDYLSRLAFLICMNPELLKEGDFPNFELEQNDPDVPPIPNLNNAQRAYAVLEHIKETHPEHYDNLYHYAKICEETGITSPRILPMSTSLQTSVGLYRWILHNHPNHIESLYALANLADRCVRHPLEEKKAEPPFFTLDKLKYAAEQYRKVLSSNSQHEGALLSLAEAIQTKRIEAQNADFFPEENIDVLSTTNAQQAAVLYRRILARNPNHIETLCALAQLIRNGAITAQASDFLGPIPPTRWQQIEELYERAKAVPLLNSTFMCGRKQRVTLSNLGEIVHKERENTYFMNKTAPNLFSTLAQDRIIRNYDNLPGYQKDRINDIIANAKSLPSNYRESYRKAIITTFIMLSCFSIMGSVGKGLHDLGNSSLSLELEYPLLAMGVLLLMALNCFLYSEKSEQLIESYIRPKLIISKIEADIRDARNADKLANAQIAANAISTFFALGILTGCGYGMYYTHQMLPGNFTIEIILGECILAPALALIAYWSTVDFITPRLIDYVDAEQERSMVEPHRAI